MKKILIICLCIVIFGHGAKLSEASKRQMDKVLIEFIENGEKYNCENIIKSKNNIDKKYGKKHFGYLVDECRSYFWGTTEDCLYCGQWGGPMGRGYKGQFWVSRFGYLYLVIRETPDEILHRCWKIKYRVKEELSPIHVVLETEPDEDGGYCIGKEVEVEVNIPLRWSTRLVLSASVDKEIESKIQRRHFKNFGGKPQGNQVEQVKEYEKYFGELEVDRKDINKKKKAK